MEGYGITVRRGKLTRRLVHQGPLPDGLVVGALITFEGESWAVIRVKREEIFAAFRVEKTPRGSRLVQTY